MRQLSPAPVYYVRSSRNPRRFYRIDTDPATGTLVCECPDRAYRRRSCKHEAQVIRGIVTAAMPKGQPAAPRGTVDELYAAVAS